MKGIPRLHASDDYCLSSRRLAIEIHHRTPVHLMENEAVVDPRVDLVPFCSHCDSRARKTDPPIQIEELKQLIVIAADQSVDTGVV